ncbi:unnamed protein product [Amoebophrya sp. A120]|nr:unnamed protein product [Amoebophrya sp. A120]|eukprot:GSA120T00018239001.1
MKSPPIALTTHLHTCISIAGLFLPEDVGARLRGKNDQNGDSDVAADRTRSHEDGPREEDTVENNAERTAAGTMSVEVGARATFVQAEDATDNMIGDNKKPRGPPASTIEKNKNAGAVEAKNRKRTPRGEHQANRFSTYRGNWQWCFDKGFWCSRNVLEARPVVGDLLACKCSPRSLRLLGIPFYPAINFTPSYVPWNSPVAIEARVEEDGHPNIIARLLSSRNSPEDIQPVSWRDWLVSLFSPNPRYLEERRQAGVRERLAAVDRSLRSSADFISDKSTIPGFGLGPVDAARDLQAVHLDGTRTGQRGRWDSASNSDPFLLHYTQEIEKKMQESGDQKWETRMVCDIAQHNFTAYSCQQRHPLLPHDIERYYVRVPVTFDNWCLSTCFAFFYEDIKTDFFSPGHPGNRETQKRYNGTKVRKRDDVVGGVEVDLGPDAGSGTWNVGVWGAWGVQAEIERYAENGTEPGAVVKLDFLAVDDDPES